MATSQLLCTPKNERGCCFITSGRISTILLLLFISFNGWSQPGRSYDEVPVQLQVPRMGNTEMTILLQNEEVFIPVKDFFDFLKIKNTPSAHLDSLSGFFIHPNASYLIDQTHNFIQYQEKIFTLSPGDLILTDWGIYLKTNRLAEVFGLDLQFSFRHLSLTLNTQAELPAFRELQQELMRKNIRALKGEHQADTMMGRSRDFFHFGVADWSITSTQVTNQAGNTRADINIGATVAGGETNVHLIGNTDQSFHLAQQLYRWHYVNNDRRAIRQITLGRIMTPTVSSIFAPVNGIELTNAPTTYRKSFGSYRYTGTTQPDWMVELYVNQVLVNYEKADASGFFSFDIPLVYGTTSIILKFYGPWGEENSKEESLSIPFNFLPRHEWEYSLSAGLVQDQKNSRFSRASLNYGLGERVTVGGGMEYLSSVMSARPMPFLTTSVRLGTALIVNGLYSYGVLTTGTLNYHLPSNGQLDISYTRYEKGQTPVWDQYLQERKASLSFPVYWKKLHAFSRLSYNQYLLQKSAYSTIEWLVSAVIAGVSCNYKSFAQFGQQPRPTVYSSLSFSFGLPWSIRFTPQIQFQYDRGKMSQVKAEMEKQLVDRGFLSLSYENNPLLHTSLMSLGFRYQFSFAQTFFTATRGNHTTTATQSAKGSLVYEAKAKYFHSNGGVSVGRGGFIILPFLDLNGNGHREANEPKVGGLNLRVNGGRVERNDSDTTIRVTGLEGYRHYLIELDKSSLENIAWQLRKRTIDVSVEPNRLRLLEIPVSVVGEASGMVYLQYGQQQKGLSRMLVNFYDSSSRLVGKTLSESDGYFSFLGLTPGQYTARIDSGQLQVLHLFSLQPALSFTITSSEEGTIADGFEFVLKALEHPLPIPNKAITNNEEPSKRETKSQVTVSENEKTTNRGKQDIGTGKGQNKTQKYSAFVHQGETMKNKKPKDFISGKKNIGSLMGAPKSVLKNYIRKQVKHQHGLVNKDPINKKRVPPANKKQLRNSIRQLLKADQQKLIQRSQQDLKILKDLIIRQQELIRRQKELIKEIRRLKKQLLIKK